MFPHIQTCTQTHIYKCPHTYRWMWKGKNWGNRLHYPWDHGLIFISYGYLMQSLFLWPKFNMQLQHSKNIHWACSMGQSFKMLLKQQFKKNGQNPFSLQLTLKLEKCCEESNTEWYTECLGEFSKSLSSSKSSQGILECYHQSHKFKSLLQSQIW